MQIFPFAGASVVGLLILMHQKLYFFCFEFEFDLLGTGHILYNFSIYHNFFNADIPN